MTAKSLPMMKVGMGACPVALLRTVYGDAAAVARQHCGLGALAWTWQILATVSDDAVIEKHCGPACEMENLPAPRQGSDTTLLASAAASPAGIARSKGSGGGGVAGLGATGGGSLGGGTLGGAMDPMDDDDDFWGGGGGGGMGAMGYDSDNSDGNGGDGGDGGNGTESEAVHDPMADFAW